MNKKAKRIRKKHRKNRERLKVRERERRLAGVQKKQRD